MSPPLKRLKHHLPSAALIVLLTLHTFLMNGYHHLDRYLPVGTYVDPIAAKADPSLFTNSLYVEAVNRTGVKLSVIDGIYPYLYRHFDFETCAIAISVVSLFFMLAGIFTLGTDLSRSRAAGAVAMFLYTAELNSWTLGSPAPYVNFFHHSLPFAYPLILWSLVYFLRGTYVPAMLLAGISWCFHPMCTVFLLFAYGTYWLFNRRAFTAGTLAASMLAFLAPALLTVGRASGYLGQGTPADQTWMTVIRWTAWYTCFPSLWPPVYFIRAGLFLTLFGISLAVVPAGLLKNKIITLASSVFVLCLLGTVFAEVYPVPFIIRLSLWRSTIIYLFLALPCIALLLTGAAHHGIAGRFLAVVTAVLLTGYIKSFPLYYLPLFIGFLAAAIPTQQFTGLIPFISKRFSSLLPAALALLLAYQVLSDSGAPRLCAFFAFTIICLLAERMLAAPGDKGHTRLLWLVALACIALGDLGILYHRGGPAIYYHGRIQGKVDPWADIQLRSRDASARDDLFIIPPYLNSFGIYSLRATLGDWPEGGNALYLDLRFAHEWFSRMQALGWKQQHGAFEAYTDLSTGEILAAAEKYGARFVISEKPKSFDLQTVCENDSFILYQIF